MADVPVRCITLCPSSTRPTSNPHERITHLGGRNWTWLRSEVIRSIEDGSNTFYLFINNQRADLVVVEGASGKYLQAATQDGPSMALLDLSVCTLW